MNSVQFFVGLDCKNVMLESRNNIVAIFLLFKATNDVLPSEVLANSSVSVTERNSVSYWLFVFLWFNKLIFKTF